MKRINVKLKAYRPTFSALNCRVGPAHYRRIIEHVIEKQYVVNEVYTIYSKADKYMLIISDTRDIADKEIRSVHKKARNINCESEYQGWYNYEEEDI